MRGLIMIMIVMTVCSVERLTIFAAKKERVRGLSWGCGEYCGDGGEQWGVRWPEGPGTGLDILLLLLLLLSLPQSSQLGGEDGRRSPEDLLPVSLSDISLRSHSPHQLHHSVDPLQYPVQSRKSSKSSGQVSTSARQEGVGVVSLVEGGLKISGQTHLLNSLYAHRYK